MGSVHPAERTSHRTPMSSSAAVYAGGTTILIGVLGLALWVVSGSLGPNFVRGSFVAIILGCVLTLFGLRE